MMYCENTSVRPGASGRGEEAGRSARDSGRRAARPDRGDGADLISGRVDDMDFQAVATALWDGSHRRFGTR